MADGTSLVVDASVIIEWFSEEELTDAALRIRRSSVEGELDVFVPDILLYELSNALRYNPSFDEGDVTAAVESILAVDLEIVMPARELLSDAIELACEHDFTVYDAAYVALADALDSTVVTADVAVAQLERARSLSEFQPTAG